ncbi:MAG: hypothetical protein HYW06_10370 [Gemmatimonadetes bacterium]|nr:hypothetical protein [Gemmatimonadota bacterium]MBI2537342.1 hypothetical protein [Gemmatimonadota bacterium]
MSQNFYKVFGDEITNELVNWFNQVDATYRAEFKDLFEVHFSKFDAKLEQRTADLRTELPAVEVRLIRWMFLFWIGSLGTTIALIKL